MIVEGLLTVLGGILTLLFSLFHLPSLPDSVETAFQAAFQHIINGISFFSSFTHWGFLTACFGVAVAVEAAFLVYRFILWVLKKIPIAGVE